MTHCFAYGLCIVMAAALSATATASPVASERRPDAPLSILRLTQSGDYRPPSYGGAEPPRSIAPRGDAYSPPPRDPEPRTDDYAPRGDAYSAPRGDAYVPPRRDEYAPRGGDAYAPPPRGYDAERYPPPPPPSAYRDDRSYTTNEILDAGHRFFGTVSKNLANVIEYAFSKQGRPNGYILGEEAGGALFAGLRYGEGRLFTKFDGDHPVYWQGPSIGYDVGGEGSKTLILVYNLSYADQLYQRFAGVDGSAYFVGGVGLTFQKQGDVVLAPIRSGVGLRFGANVGYLKYSRQPTWNPF